MILYPAMDLMGGQCVRLAQGRFDDATLYTADPPQALADFARAGATWAHVVDLDGARAGKPVQHEFIAGLAAEAVLKLQVAGGFRTASQVAAMLEAGAGRVVIGSLAVKDPAAVRSLFADHGAERLALALDVNIIDGRPMVATAGWTESSTQSLYDILAFYPGARHVLVTDIGRDGMLSGPNLELMVELCRRFPDIAWQASGGIATLQDLEAVVRLGAGGAIVGKAYWEGKLDLAEAIRIAGA